MEHESPRRRVRRANQSRPVAPGHTDPVAGMERPPSPPSAEADLPAEAATEPDVLQDDTAAGPGQEPEALADSGRDGAWLPAGITVLVMVSLLICAGLVLIASRQ